MPNRKNIELRMKLLELANKGLCQSAIAKELSVSPTAILKNFRRLEADGLIQIIKGRPTFYKLTDNGRINLFSLHKKDKPFTENKISLHDFKLLIPIVKHGNFTLSSEKKVKINNWTKKYYNIELPTKLTLEITTKSAILHFKETQIPRSLGITRAISEFTMKGMVAVASMLGSHGFKLDLMNARVINQHIASKTAKEIDEQVPKSTVFKMGLNRQAETITGKMDAEATAWIDRSQTRLEIETNDLLYEEKLITMPLWVQSIENRTKRMETMINAIGMQTDQLATILEKKPTPPTSDYR